MLLQLEPDHGALVILTLTAFLYDFSSWSKITSTFSNAFTFSRCGSLCSYDKTLCNCEVFFILKSLGG